MLEAFAADGRFWKGNLHGHSTGSDGKLTPAEACAAYKSAGYDFTCVTDHFRTTYGYPVTDTGPFRDATFTTIVGAELHAPETSRGVEWHILAVGLPLDFAPPAPNESGPALARRARAAGAFIAIPHPHWYQLQVEDGEALDAAQAVEVLNHTSAVHADRGDGLVFYDTMLSRGHRLGAIAVDDSHWKNGDAFGAWVMVKAPALTPEALLAALHAGHYYASEGPEIHDIRREGDALVLQCTPARSILVVGAVSQSAQAHGRSLTSARLPLDRFAGGWCRAVVIDASGRRAWSNPLWFE